MPVGITSLISSDGITVDAAAGAGGGHGGGGGYANDAFSFQCTNAPIVMRIGISNISDETDDTNMGQEIYRYGNGGGQNGQHSVDMHAYPLLIKAAFRDVDNGGTNIYKPDEVPNGDYGDNMTIGAENLPNTILGEMRTAANKAKKIKDAVDDEYIGNGNKPTRTTWSAYGLNGVYERNIEYWGDKFHTYKGSDTVGGISGLGTSVYLEMAIQKALTLYDNEKISGQDLKDFWYFYTRMAWAAQSNYGGRSGSGSFTSGMGEALNNMFLGWGGYKWPILKDENRRVNFQSGYLVALYVVYGNDAYSKVTGESFDPNTSNKHLFGQNFVSLVFDKCWTQWMDNQEGNNKYQLLSIHDIAEHVVATEKYTHLNAYTTEARTGLGWNAGFNSALNNICGMVGMPMYSNLRPAYTYDKKDENGNLIVEEGTIRGSELYAGWAYYEIVSGNEPYMPSFPHYENAQLEVTYNAFLSNDDDDNYVDDNGNYKYERESENFGDNGHVMTDTVYLSDVIEKDKLLDIKGGYIDKGKVFNIEVPESIALSTPFKNTQYNLRNLRYRLVNAGGSLKTGDNTEINQFGDGSSESNALGVKTKDVSDAFKEENAKVYLRLRIPITNNSIYEGKYTDAEGEHFYNVYGTDSNGSIIGEKIKLSNAKEDIKDAWEGIKNRNEQENTDSEFYHNGYCLEIKLGDNYYRYYPIILENNVYYICPRIEITNILVQMRADYVSSYKKDDVLNYKNNNGETVQKSIGVSEYLLDKNYSTDGLQDTASTNKGILYSMIDNYATDQWGDNCSRANSYMLINGSVVNVGKNEYHDRSTSRHSALDMKGNPRAGNQIAYDYNFIFGTLFNDINRIYTDDSVYTDNYVRWEYDENGKFIKINKNNNDKIVNSDFNLFVDHRVIERVNVEKAKKLFRTYIEKTAPIIANSTTTDLTYINSNFTANIAAYGSSIGDLDSNKVDKSGLYYTASDGDNYNTIKVKSFNTLDNDKTNYKMNSNRSGRTGIAGIGDYLYTNNSTSVGNGTRYMDSIKDDAYPRYSAEKGICESPLEKVVDLTAGGKDGQIKLESETKRNYVQAAFNKLLTTYNKVIYSTRGSLDSTLTPTVASWIKGGDTYATAYNMSIGTNNQPDYIGNVKSNADIDKGFIRYGKTDLSKAVIDGITKQDKYFYADVDYIRTILNSQHAPASKVLFGVSTGIDSKDTYVSDKINNNVHDINTIAALTQNSYDIPLRYTIKSHNTASISPVKQSDIYTKSSNDNSISLSYQYDGSGISNSNIVKQDGKAYIGVYPEVTMWAENNLGHIFGSSSSDKYEPVSTVGVKRRYIPAMTYSTVKFNDLKAKVNVLGTAVAYDTRAKKLAASLGTSDTQVLYSGSAINGSVDASASGTVKTYAFAFKGGDSSHDDGIINGVNVKDAWGNSGYKAENAAISSMNKLLGNFKVSQSNKLAVYNGYSYNEADIGTEVVDGALTADTPVRDVIYYDLMIKGGRVKEVSVKAYDNGKTFNIIKYNLDTGNISRDSYSHVEAIKQAYTKLKNSDLSSSAKVIIEKYLFNSNHKENGIYVAHTDDVNGIINDIIEVLTNMKLRGKVEETSEDISNTYEDTIIYRAFEWGTGVNLPGSISSSAPNVMNNYLGNSINPLRANKKSYSEDCSVLQIRSYSAKVKTSNSRGTFTEQIPINLGPKTPVNRNDYFSNGYKGYINTNVKVIVNSDNIPGYVKNSTIMSVANKHKVKNSSNEIIVKDKDTAESTVPDFIIGDVPISEALNG